MAIEKKSLMNSRTAAKKAVIARKTAGSHAPQRGAVVAAPGKNFLNAPAKLHTANRVFTTKKVATANRMGLANKAF